MVVYTNENNITGIFTLQAGVRPRYFLLVPDIGIVEFTGTSYDYALIYERGEINETTCSYRLKLTAGVCLVEVNPLGLISADGSRSYLRVPTVQFLIEAMNDMLANQLHSRPYLNISDAAILAAALEYFPNEVEEAVTKTIQ
jgi:hypothetical protein